MNEIQNQSPSVERLPDKRSTIITEELNRILALLKDACPEGSAISFDFDGKLQVHVDVNSFEAILKVEGILPTLGGGLFYGTTRGQTPHRPFYHRLSAYVER